MISVRPFSDAGQTFLHDVFCLRTIKMFAYLTVTDRVSSPGHATHLYHSELSPLVILHQNIFQLNSSKLIKFYNVLKRWIIDRTFTWNRIYLYVQLLSHYYRPLTKLRKGNVFSRVCVSTGRSPVTITHDTLDLTLQAPAPQRGTSLDRGPPRLQSFLTWHLIGQGPLPY